MHYSLDNTVAKSLLALGESKQAKQLILSENSLGLVQIRGNLPTKRALALLENAVLREESATREWLRQDLKTFPLLALPLPELLKQGNQVKTAAAAAVNWMMKPTNTKLGRDKFLFWWHPIEKSFLIHTSHLVKKLPEVFTLGSIIEWADLAGTSMANGNLSSMKPESGVTVHQNLTKIVVEAAFLVVNQAWRLEHGPVPPNPCTWVKTPAPSTTSGPGAGGLRVKTPARPTLPPSKSSLGQEKATSTPVLSARSPGLPNCHQAPSTSSPAPGPGKSASSAPPASPAVSPVIRRSRPRTETVATVLARQQEGRGQTSYLEGSTPAPRPKGTVQASRTARETVRSRVEQPSLVAEHCSSEEPSVAEEDDIELALGLSVSRQIHQAESVLLSSQIYREDERRRRELLHSEDMFAESTTEYEPEELEEGEIAPILETTSNVDKSGGNEKEHDEKDNTMEEGEEEVDDLPRHSQYIPFLLREENRKRTHDESEAVEDEDKDSDEEVFNQEDITMKKCWIGEKEDANVWNSAKVESIPQSRSKYVSIRPQPTKIMKPRIDNVQDSSLSRLMKTIEKKKSHQVNADMVAAHEVVLSSTRPALLAKTAPLLDKHGIDDDVLYDAYILDQPLQLPVTLQLLSHREEGKDLIVAMSDSQNCKDFIMTSQYAYLFRQNILKPNCLIKVKSVKRKGDYVVLKNIEIVSNKMTEMIGDPIEI